MVVHSRVPPPMRVPCMPPPKPPQLPPHLQLARGDVAALRWAVRIKVRVERAVHDAAVRQRLREGSGWAVGVAENHGEHRVCQGPAQSEGHQERTHLEPKKLREVSERACHLPP